MKCCCNSSFGTWRSGLAAVGFAVFVSWAFTGLPVLLGYGEPGAGDRAGEIFAVVLVPLWVAMGMAEGRLSKDGKGSGEECTPTRPE